MAIAEPAAHGDGDAPQGQRRERLVDALVVLVATAALYANTLGVPPYLDDGGQMRMPEVRDLGLAWARILGSRGVAVLTLALNFRLTGLDVRWLHGTNVAIHAVASLLVLACLRKAFPGDRLRALFAALLFAAHPLQTQAVTYIVQRMTSLSGLFSFGAVLLFVSARGARDAGASLASRSHLLRYGGALLAAALALLSKQNAAVLPGLLLLFGAFFLPRTGWPLRRLALYVAPFALVPLALGGGSLLVRVAGGEGVMEAGAVGRVFGAEYVSPLRYFATEWGVLWTYLRLLVFPFGQALLYDTPIVASPFEAGPLLHLAGLIALVVGAALLRRRWPTLLFGVLWFLVALSVESTLIPLDPVFEHRLYVPLFGFACAAAGGLGFLTNARARAAVAVTALVILSGLTIRRNALWNDPVAFLEDNLARAPWSARLPSMLAREYRLQGRDAEAETLLVREMEDHGPAPRMAADLAALFVDQGRIDEAERLLAAARASGQVDPELIVIEARLLEKRHDLDGAIAALERAARLEPNRVELRVNVGLLEAARARTAEAEQQFRRALAVDPSSSAAQFNLGVALLQQGRISEGRDAFLAAARLDPADPRPVFNAGVASLRLGDVPAAEALLPELERRSPQEAGELAQRIGAARAGAPLP